MFGIFCFILGCTGEYIGLFVLFCLIQIPFADVHVNR